MGVRLFIQTYGCQMNELDSELVGRRLASEGYSFVGSAEEADVVLINTCSVRALAEQKVWSELGRLAILKETERPELVVGVLGCMAEQQSKRLASRTKHVSIVCGPSHLGELPEMLARARRGEGRQVALAGHTARRSATLDAASERLEALDRSRTHAPGERQPQAFVRVTRGCNKLCSFCVVPFVRGPEAHRAPDAIVDEVRQLVDGGALEVTLIGQTINHYRYEEGGKATSFAELLWRIHEEVTALPRLRFVTSYPRDFGDDILDVMAAAPRICRFLHLPAQSGSSRLLKLMNRGYSAEEYGALIERARARLPDVRFAGDMIVGFPTESDEDHRASIGLLERVRYKNAFIFKYSPREGTAAARRLADDVPEEVKKTRNLEMLEVQAGISRDANLRRVGERHAVLVESEGKLRADRKPEGAGEATSEAASDEASDSRPAARPGWRRLIGRTVGDEIVAFDGPPELIGRIVEVQAVAATHLTILGELVG
jgi:tRNA-2-methylthio-N6-dimethylallyladenosine synthase